MDMSHEACVACGRSDLGVDERGRCPDCTGGALDSGTETLGAATASVVYAPGPPRPRPRPADALVGRELGGCRLISRIGGGGMGVVYRAEQLSLGRTVAVKLVRTLNAE